MIPAPKFKQGDMVQVVACGWHAWDSFMQGRIGTINGIPYQRRGSKNPFATEWAYPVDIITPEGKEGNIAEYCLRLIRDGDLKLDCTLSDEEIPA